MSRGARSDILPAAIIHGIEAAEKLYSSLTCGHGWLGEAPEYLVTIEVARSLGKRLGTRWINLEYGVRQALRDAGSTRRGRPKEVQRTRGRYDILLSRKGGDPWCVVEVKSPVWSVSVLEQDIRRICATLGHREHGATISCAALAFYSDRGPPRRKHSSAKSWLRSLAPRAEQKMRDIVEHGQNQGRLPSGISVKVHSGRFHKSGDEGWQAFCAFFRITKPRRKSTEE